MRHKDHDIYDGTDFTEEELNDRNKLAVMVLDWGMKICKYCGKSEDELTCKCQSRHGRNRRKH